MSNVDILIPTKNRQQTLPLCLTSLAFQQPAIKGRVLISDEGDTSIFESKQVRQAYDILSFYMPVEYYRQKEPLGIAGNRKFLLEKAEADEILWVDDDLAVYPKTVCHLLTISKALKKDYGFITGIMIDADNTKGWNDYHPLIMKREEWEKLSIDGKVSRLVEPPVVKEISRGAGGCILCRTDRMRSIDGLQPAFNYGGEDVVYTSLLSNKWKCYFVSSALFWHFPPGDSQWSWMGASYNLAQEYLSKRGVGNEHIKKINLFKTKGRSKL